MWMGGGYEAARQSNLQRREEGPLISEHLPYPYPSVPPSFLTNSVE